MTDLARKLFASTGLGILVCLPMAAEAQTAAREAPTGVDEVIVTAQRRSQSLQDVPIAITALSGETLASASVSNVMDLPMLSPSLIVTPNNAFTRPFLRGVGTPSAGAGTESSVATYIDGVYIASQPSALASLADVERVEILRGPQGTLYGRNATGGLIHVITREPEEHFSGSASIGYGNYGTTRGDFYMAGPIAGNLLANVTAGMTHQEEGYGRNIFNGEFVDRIDLDLAVRGKLLWHVTERSDVTLGLDYSNRLGNQPGQGQLFGATSRYYAPPDATAPHDVNVNQQQEQRLIGRGATLRVVHEAPSVTITSLSAYRVADFDTEVDSDFTPTPAVNASFNQRDIQFSQEFQLASPSGNRLYGRDFQWTLGAYYLDASSRIYNHRIALGGPLAAGGTNLTDATQYTESVAVFGEATIEVWDATNLTAGLRYTDETRRIRGSQDHYDFGGVFTNTNFSNVERSVAYSPTTWRFVLDHAFNDDVMGYVSYSRGFKAGGFATQNPLIDPYNPEILDSYEVGLKSELFGRRVRANVAAFYYDYSDMQVTAYTPAGLPAIYNGSNSEIYGIDGDIEIRATDSLTLTGGMQLIHNEFTFFPAAQISSASPLGGRNLAPGSAQGNHLPFAADTTFTLGAEYVVPLPQSNLRLNAEYRHSSGYYFEPDNFLHQSAFDVFNAAAVLEADNGWSARVWVKNITDEVYAIWEATVSTTPAASYGPPRTYGITLGKTF